MELPFRRLLERLLSPRILRFAAVGFSGVFINLGTLAIFSELLHFSDLASQPIGVEVSIIWNFFLNDAWTFRDKNAGAEVELPLRLLRYNLVSLIGLAIQTGTFFLCSKAALHLLGRSEPGLWKYPIALVGIALATAWNFLSNASWTWAQSSARAPEGAAPAPATNSERT